MANKKFTACVTCGVEFWGISAEGERRLLELFTPYCGEHQFIATFEVRDFGTERVLTVRRGDKIIEQSDPFWPKGVPASKRSRAKKLHDRVSQVVTDCLRANGEPTDRIRYSFSYPASFA